MNTKLFGEAFLATIAFGSPILQVFLKPEESHYETHIEIEYLKYNSRIGNSIYKIEKIQSAINKTDAQLVTLLD